MTQNYSIKIYNCEFCDYTTIRRFNLIRHQNAIHNNIENKKRCIKISRENVSPVGENVSPVGENVNPVGENVNPVSENVSPKFICKKCKNL